MKRKPKDDRVHPPDAYCRSCIRDCGGQPYREAAIGKDDAVVPICVSCSDEPAVERDNLFGGGRGGIGDGNRRTWSRR